MHQSKLEKANLMGANFQWLYLKLVNLQEVDN